MTYNPMREMIASRVRCDRKPATAGPRAACSQRIRDREVFDSKRGSRMRRIALQMAGALTILAPLGACVMPPTIPAIPVAPGPNKTFEAFAAEQSYCQQYATAQTAPQAYAATNQAVGTAILTTALGAALGGAIGGGHAAGIGAASGAAFGTVVGAGSSGFAQMSLQQQFDIMYGQCMYAYGNRVPGFAPPGTPPYPGVPGASSYGPLSYDPAPYGPPPR